MTSPGASTTSGGTLQVLSFSDGSQKLADPDLYLPKGLAGQISQDSDLANEIIEAFSVSVATAMTVAATKSAAQTRE